MLSLFYVEGISYQKKCLEYTENSIILSVADKTY